MIHLLAQGCILIAAGWLVCVSLIALAAPETARRGLASMGSTAAIQFGEHIPRAVVGIAFVVRAAESKAPLLFSAGGWFLLVTSIAIMLAPRHWHAQYARWWAERIPRWGFRMAALAALPAAAAIAYAAL